MLFIVKFIYNMIFFQEGFVLYSIFYPCNEIFLYVEFDKQPATEQYFGILSASQITI